MMKDFVDGDSHSGHHDCNVGDSTVDKIFPSSSELESSSQKDIPKL